MDKVLLRLSTHNLVVVAYHSRTLFRDSVVILRVKDQPDFRASEELHRTIMGKDSRTLVKASRSKGRIISRGNPTNSKDKISVRAVINSKSLRTSLLVKVWVSFSNRR